MQWFVATTSAEAANKINEGVQQRQTKHFQSKLIGLMPTSNDSFLESLIIPASNQKFLRNRQIKLKSSKK